MINIKFIFYLFKSVSKYVEEQKRRDQALVYFYEKRINIGILCFDFILVLLNLKSFSFNCIILDVLES